MRERSTRTEALRAGTPVRLGAVVLLPVERVLLQSDRGDTHLWFSAAKEPHALIVCDAGGTRGIDMDAMPVSLEALRERVPALDSLLALADLPVHE
jgi:hypothetical protein